MSGEVDRPFGGSRVASFSQRMVLLLLESPQAPEDDYQQR